MGGRFFPDPGETSQVPGSNVILFESRPSGRTDDGRIPEGSFTPGFVKDRTSPGTAALNRGGEEGEFW